MMLELCQFFFDHGFFRWLGGLIYIGAVGTFASYAFGNMFQFTWRK